MVPGFRMYSSVLSSMMSPFDFYSHVFTTPPPPLDDSSDSDCSESPFSPIDPVTPVDPPSSPLPVEFVGEWSDTLTQPPGGVEAPEDADKAEESSASSSASISAGGLGGCAGGVTGGGTGALAGTVVRYDANGTLSCSTYGPQAGTVSCSSHSSTDASGAVNSSGSTSSPSSTQGMNASGAMTSGSTYHTGTMNGSEALRSSGSSHYSTEGMDAPRAMSTHHTVNVSGMNSSGSIYGTVTGSHGTMNASTHATNGSGATISSDSSYHTMSTQGMNATGSTQGTIDASGAMSSGTMTGLTQGMNTPGATNSSGSYHTGTMNASTQGITASGAMLGSTQGHHGTMTGSSGAMNSSGSSSGMTGSISGVSGSLSGTAGTVLTSPTTSRASILSAFEYTSPSTSTSVSLDPEISALFETPSPPAFPISLYAVKESDFPGIFDNYQTALNHAADKKNVVMFSSMEAAAVYMSPTEYKVYHTSDNLKVLAKSCIYNVFTDGSFTGGFDKGSGYGGIGVWFGENHPDNVAAQMTGDEMCSQQAELEALLEAYKIIYRRKDTRTYEIFCDCQTAIDLVKMRYLVHSRFKETVQEIQMYKNAIPASCTVYLTRILGHNGNPGNERAHYLANMGRQGDHGRYYPCVNGALRDNMDNGIYGLRAKYL